MASGKNGEVEPASAAMRADIQSLPIELSTIVDSPDCVKIIDGLGRLEYINRVGREALGIGDVDISGKMWLDLLPDDTRSAGQTAIEGAAKGKSQHFMGTSAGMSGATRYWDNNLIPIGSSIAGAPKILCISRDITDDVLVKSLVSELMNNVTSPQVVSSEFEKFQLPNGIIASLSDNLPDGAVDISASVHLASPTRSPVPYETKFILTPKERESLFWVGKGKTAFETAVITGRSRRTIEFHLANATRKLRASNKVQAALIAFAHRLI